MADGSTRIIGLATVLVGVWVVTYWFWQPRKVTLDPRTGPGALPRVVEERPKPVGPGAGAVGGTEQNQGTATESRGTRNQGTPGGSPVPHLGPQGTRLVEKVIPPQFRDYTVQKGDTSFEKIAARREVFGNSKMGEAVSRSNPYVTPDRLKVGQTVLKIPLDPENIQGKTVWVEVGPDGQVVQKPAGESAAGTTPETPAKAERTYTLRAEDTLSSVAEQFYGKSSMWKVIAEANKDVVPNPNKLKPGTVVRIPAQ